MRSLTRGQDAIYGVFPWTLCESRIIHHNFLALAGRTGSISIQDALETTAYYPALVWLETNQDFSSLSGSSIIGDLSVIKWNNVIYAESGPILFTHWWISGPAVFNASLFMKESPTVTKYRIKIEVSNKEITKRLLSFLWFRTNKLDEYKITSDVLNVRWLNEAKVSWWGVETENLNQYFECKNIPWLYFIWECVDVTGKTWWFNLQWCWTSWAVCADGINTKKG